eukprot:6191974-Pleurochrysis_carterae.AAC.1
MKVAFKYSYLDKINDSQRERATSYLESIGCFLDLRAKGVRNPKQKWMNGAAVDDFIMGQLGDPKSKSPGIAVNPVALCEIVYAGGGGAPEAADGDSQPTPPLPPRPRGGGARKRRQAPTAGFATGAAPSAEEDIDLSAMDNLTGGEDETVADDELRSYIRK